MAVDDLIAVADLRSALDEAYVHATVCKSVFRTLDLLGGYDQIKWRIPVIVDALIRAYDALDVPVAPEQGHQTRIDLKAFGCEGEASK